MNTHLYKICFTYNPYKDLWYACEAQYLDNLWNGIENHNIIKAKNKETLISYFNEGKHLVDVPKNTTIEEAEFDSKS